MAKGLYSSDYAKAKQEHLPELRAIAAKRLALMIKALDDCNKELSALYPSKVHKDADYYLGELLPKLAAYQKRLECVARQMGFPDAT